MSLLAVVAPAVADKFVLFGGVHLTVLFLTVALPVGLSWLTRGRDRPLVARSLALALGMILLFDRVFALSIVLAYKRVDHWPDALPMHLCDWASFVVIFALIWRGQLAYELAYFWGLSGTLQAILTPDLAENFPNPFFFSFFISHCGIVVAVLFMTWGLGKRPWPGAVWRAWLWSQLYLVCAALVNWLGHTNFGYLAAKPLHASLLDKLGPWPWYILALESLSFVFYLILYAPFWIADQRRGGVTLPPVATPLPVHGNAPRSRWDS